MITYAGYQIPDVSSYRNREHSRKLLPEAAFVFWRNSYYSSQKVCEVTLYKIREKVHFEKSEELSFVSNSHSFYCSPFVKLDGYLFIYFPQHL